MSIKPTASSSTVIEGSFSFQAAAANKPAITDSYEIRVTVPAHFPRAVPPVEELNNKIPKRDEYHVNHDGTLCLGSPIRLISIISKKPTLVGFAEKCIVPYLYAVSLKLQRGGRLVFDELAHGYPGIIDDYVDLFRLKSKKAVIATLNLIGTKRRIANKKECPCSCGRRLGKCDFNKSIREYRSMASRGWFKGQAENIEKFFIK
jgi:hypothetical protein